MVTITAPVLIQQLLEGVGEKAEIRDGQGNVLGYFTPLAVFEAEMYERAKALFDPAETERIAREEHGKGRPLAEFWKEMTAQESGQ